MKIKEDIDIWNALSEAGFTEKQCEAIYNVIDAKIDWFCSYIEDYIKDEDKQIAKLLREHRHTIQGEAVIPI